MHDRPFVRCTDPRCPLPVRHTQHPRILSWCRYCMHPLDVHDSDVELSGDRHELDMWCAACAGQVCRHVP